jgi:tRNA threonylcarbamoyladenosine biosynthesis protein TsaE
MGYNLSLKRAVCAKEAGLSTIMAILDEKTLDFISTSVAQTERLGVRLGELLQRGDVVCLSGPLGAGKTVMARGIGRGWGTAQRITSPTFSLVNEYPRLGDRQVLYHIDCYRLSTTAEIATVGLEDILDAGGAFMIEWPKQIEPLLPADRLQIALRFLSETRRGMRIAASGDRSTQLLKAFKRSAFGV